MYNIVGFFHQHVEIMQNTSWSSFKSQILKHCPICMYIRLVNLNEINIISTNMFVICTCKLSFHAYINILQAMAIQTLPQNAVQSWTNLSRVVDDIWFYAGDKSNDVSSYG